LRVHETAKLTLIMARNGEGKQPIMVNDIAVKVEPVTSELATRVWFAADYDAAGSKERKNRIVPASQLNQGGRRMTCGECETSRDVAVGAVIPPDEMNNETVSGAFLLKNAASLI
jgi:hypothetical protein